jgi:hypothetical protein
LASGDVQEALAAHWLFVVQGGPQKPRVALEVSKTQTPEPVGPQSPSEPHGKHIGSFVDEPVELDPWLGVEEQAASNSPATAPPR